MEIQASQRLAATNKSALPKYLGGMSMVGDYTKTAAGKGRDGGFWVRATYKGTLNMNFSEFLEYEAKVKKSFPAAEQFLIAQNGKDFAVEFFTKKWPE